MSTRTLPAIAASLAILVFTSVLFFPALFQGKILAPLDITTRMLAPWNETASGVKAHNQSPSDAVTQYLPYRLFVEKSFNEDGYIGWNPYEIGGYSLAANTMALPGSWPVQLHRFLPFKDAWNFGIIAEFLIAGSGMLVFLRGRKLPWLPCLIGTVAFMFNAQFIVWIYHRWTLGSFCWMPWVLWAFGNGFKMNPLQTRIFLLPAFLALAILGGSLQHLAFIVLACGCMAAATFDLRRPLDITSSLLGWTIAFIVALGSTAFSLVPQISGYFSSLGIGQIRGGIGYESGISQPLFHALLIPARIWPWLAGDPQSMDAFRLLKSGFMELNYIGTIPMLLGLSGFFVRSMPRAAKWLIAVGLIIPLTPLVGPLYHRVELLYILGAAWMTAEMLTRCYLPSSINNQQSTIINRKSPTTPLAPSYIARTWQRLLITAVAAIGAALLIGTCLPSGIRSKLEDTVVSKALAKSEDSQFGADKKWIASRAREWTARFSLAHPRTAWVYGLLVLGTTGLVLASRHDSTPNVAGASRSRPPLGTSCSEPPAALAQEETPPSSLPINNQQSTILNQKSTPLLSHRSLGHLMILGATTLELATLFHTWTTFSDPSDLHPQNAAIETVRSIAGSHRVLQSAPDSRFTAMFAPSNILASLFIPSIDGYESIQYRSALTATMGSPDDLRLTLAGVGLAIQPTGAIQPGTESWPVAGTLGTFTLRKNPAVCSLITAGASTAVFTTPADIAAALPGTTAIRPSLQTSNRWAFEVPAGQNWIRIAQNWHEGWRWKTPGQDWKPFRDGPDAACWIDNLPPDAHHIDVQFFPRPQWLIYASLGAVFAWLCILPIFQYFGNFRSGKALSR